MAGASTLTNVSKSPLNNLALYCERGLDFLCFWGLGGTFGGLREGNIITECGRNQTISEIPIGHIKIIKHRNSVLLPHPHPQEKIVLPPFFLYLLLLIAQKPYKLFIQITTFLHVVADICLLVCLKMISIIKIRALIDPNMRT